MTNMKSACFSPAAAVFRMIFGLLILSLVSACGGDRGSREIEEDDSTLHYVPFGSIRSCGLAKARESAIKICLDPGGVGADVVTKAKNYTTHSLLTWLKALRQIDPKVTSKIEYTCTGAHMKVRMIPGAGTSYASCSSLNVYSERPYGTYLHELGHAFAALGDTYSGGAGSCIPGQPKSLMCWGAYGPNKDPQGFNMLFEDDVTGIQANYKQLFSDTTSPDSSINPLGPLDVANPWPGSNNVMPQVVSPGLPQTVPDSSLFVALGSPSTQNQQEFAVLVSAPSSVVAVMACTDSANPAACAKDQSKAIGARLVQQVNGRNIFSLNKPVALQSFADRALILYGFATESITGAAAAERRIRFKP